MSSPPPPSAPLAERLAWLAGEVRSEKEEAGRIVALFMEVFARLLSRLAGLAGRIETGVMPTSERRATPVATTPASAPVAPGLLPLVFGWLGGLLPTGGPVVFPSGIVASYVERNRSRGIFRRTTAALCAVAPVEGPGDVRPVEIDRIGLACDAGVGWVHVAPSRLRGPASVGGVLAAWRQLPASTAGPDFHFGDFSDSFSTFILLRYRNRSASPSPLEG